MMSFSNCFIAKNTEVKRNKAVVLNNGLELSSRNVSVWVSACCKMVTGEYALAIAVAFSYITHTDVVWKGVKLCIQTQVKLDNSLSL